MAREKAPAFQFYTKDWDTDVNVIPMTYEEEGVYWALCRLVWNEKFVPSNPAELRLLLKGKPSLRALQKWWGRIGKCFSDRNGFLFHKRIEIERRKQVARRKTQRENGLKGGRPKATANPRVSAAVTSGNRKQSSAFASADVRTEPPVVPQGGRHRKKRRVSKDLPTVTQSEVEAVDQQLAYATRRDALMAEGLTREQARDQIDREREAVRA